MAVLSHYRCDSERGLEPLALAGVGLMVYGGDTVHWHLFDQDTLNMTALDEPFPLVNRHISRPYRWLWSSSGGGWSNYIGVCSW